MTAPSLAMPADPTGARRSIPTELFGPLELADQQILEFPSGIFGFPACHHWTLIEGARRGTAWLQSVDHSALAFLLVDPFVYFDGFTAELSPTELRSLDAQDPGQIAVFAIVTLPRRREDTPTANLQGPLVINVVARRGTQVILGETAWGVQQDLRFD